MVEIKFRAYIFNFWVLLTSLKTQSQDSEIKVPPGRLMLNQVWTCEPWILREHIIQILLMLKKQYIVFECNLPSSNNNLSSSGIWDYQLKFSKSVDMSNLLHIDMVGVDAVKLSLCPVGRGNVDHQGLPSVPNIGMWHL